MFRFKRFFTKDSLEDSTNTVCVEQKLLGRRKGSIEYWFFLRQKGLFERAPESRTQFLNRDGSFRFEFLTNLPYHTNLISTLHNRDRHSDSTSNYCNYNQNQFYIPLRSATEKTKISPESGKDSASYDHSGKNKNRSSKKKYSSFVWNS